MQLARNLAELGQHWGGLGRVWGGLGEVWGVLGPVNPRVYDFPGGGLADCATAVEDEVFEEEESAESEGGLARLVPP